MLIAMVQDTRMFNRKRREFERYSIEHILEDEYNIKSKDLIPKPEDDYRDLQKAWDHYLFLDIFDDEDYDCRTPSDWLSLGTEGELRKPVPAMALLPLSDDLHQGKIYSISPALKAMTYCLSNPDVRIMKPL
ncbi:dynein heavy chain [Echinococcus multilocularis]|uniref:Dynein heavy chain n=1 Tax=Echinococcus multilocularis TaxID=6211 RepID=A0A068Y5F5_ECHMU|nr:dynein heavy chain [Echinococcus multilocularis]